MSSPAPSVVDLEALAVAEYRDGHYEAAVAAWEQLYARHVEAGEHVEAARAGAMVATYLLIDSGLMAPVRGWLGRVDRLLVGMDETPVHAMVAMVRGYERFMSGDLKQAKPWAARAIELGERHDVVPAQVLGRMAGARITILEGDVEEGLAALDAVAEVLLSGEVDPLTTGMMVCELVCAMQGLAQYDRAERWTTAFERMGRRGDFSGGINGRCRVHRAEIMRLRGSCEEAEAEALRACEELRPWMRREYGWPLTELGTIRLRRGDLAGAEEAFVAAHGNGWDPNPGLALLRLAQGDVAGAESLIRDALDRPLRIPSKERPPVGGLSRAPLLDAQVVIAVASGDLTTAQEACEELAGISGKYNSDALRAMTALARGRLALSSGDAVAAVAACRTAVDVWCDIGAPYETSVARYVLADAHDAVGQPDLAASERLAAAASLAEMGAVLHLPPSAGSFVAEGVAEADAREAVFRCDGNTRTLTFMGETALVRELVGMRYLERLLGAPGREFHALDLVAFEHGVLPSNGPAAVEGQTQRANEDAGGMLDDQARRAYQRRLADIDEDIAEATSFGDAERAALAEADRDYIVAELSRAFGLGGRKRQAASTSERARGSVTRSLRYAMARVAEHHPTMAEHLERAITTGTYCSYAPDPHAPVVWQVS